MIQLYMRPHYNLLRRGDIMNNRWIIVFDWETDGTDPTTCNPVELAAVPIEPRTLEIKTDKAFSTVIKPPGITKEDYFTDERQKTIEWHAKQRGVESADIVAAWKKGKSEKSEFLKKHIARGHGTYPTPAHLSQSQPDPRPQN